MTHQRLPIALLLLFLLLAAAPILATPTVEWGTLFGGDLNESATAMAVDDAGNAYLCGHTLGGLPITAGAYQASHKGNADVFIAKIDPTGTDLIYATYLGGNHSDTCTDITIDADGNVFVAIRTLSTDMPTPNGFQHTFGGTRDIYIGKLDAAGANLLYGTYLGGYGNDVIASIAVDSTGAAYVANRTDGGFPVGPGYDTSYNGGWDWVVTKIAPSGSSRVYGTYLGGSDIEFSQPQIAVDSAGAAYVTGQTKSGNFPTTSGVVQAVDPNGGGNWRESLIVTKIAPDGLSLEYSTYLGSSDGSREEGNDIAVDADGNVYVTGNFNGSDFPGAEGIDPYRYGIFASKLDATGENVIYTTHLGEGWGYSIDVDSSGAVSVCGASFYPITEIDPLQDGLAGTRDHTLAYIDPAGNATFSSYFGSNADEGHQCRHGRDSAGNLYVLSNLANTSSVWPEVPSFHFLTTSGTLVAHDGAVLKISGLPGAQPVSTVVAHASFDEGSGVTADLGNGLTGMLTGGADWTTGQQGSALEFDGTGYVEALDDGNDSPLDITDALTVVLWMRPDELGGTQVLLSKDNAYELEFGKLGPSTWDLRANNIVQGTAQTPIAEGVWQQLAVTWDGTTVRYYHNGQPDGSAAFAGPLDTNNSNLGIGARPAAPPSGPTFHFQGALDDVRLFDRALSDQEIADLFSTTVTDIVPPVRSNAAPGTAQPTFDSVAFGLDTDEAADCRYELGTGGVRYAEMGADFTTTGGLTHSDSTTPTTEVTVFYVRCRDDLGNTHVDDFMVPVLVGSVDLLDQLAAYWGADEIMGCNLLDATGSHNGLLGPDCAGGNGPARVAGVFGNALDFDGGDDEVVASTTAALQTPSTVTLAAWIRHDDTTGYRAIVDVRDGNTDGYNLYLLNGKPFMRVNDGTATSTEDVDDGEWHFVVGSYDGSTVRLYVDGFLAGSASIGAKSLQVNAPVTLGHHFTGTTNYSFAGTLDEVAIYNRALGAAEVYQLFLDTQP